MKSEKLSQYKSKFVIVILLAATIGFLSGALKSIALISSNQYIPQNMYYLSLSWITSLINKYPLIALVLIGLALIILIAAAALLKFAGVNRRHSDVILNGVIPAFLCFIVGGYELNKVYLPGFYELESVRGNAVWVVVCAIIGWFMLKISQTDLASYLRVHKLKILVPIICLVVAFNVARYLYFLSLDSGRPNVILISIDTLRADHLSCYGYNRNTSPNIDRFAKDGVLFSNAIAQSSWTLPSHMSMLTALYSSSHGVILDDRKLNDEHLTLAEVLKNAGYKTVAFTDGGYVTNKYGYQGFDLFDDKGKKIFRGGFEKTYTKALNWLTMSHSRPFFLFLHTYQVHAPFDPPSDFDIYSDKKYAGIVEVAVNTNKYYKEIEPKMTREDYLYVIDKYDGEIYYTDHFLGKLFKELRELGLYEKSIIVVTSDHGEHFLDHPDSPIRYVGHGEHKLYDEIVKVPLIINASAFPKNQIIDAQVESIDIMPTVLELLGISIPNGLDGESLLDLVKKKSYYGKVFAFSEKSSSRSEYDGYRMIRSNDWKLLLNSRGISGSSELELYNLKIDPKEQNNLFAEEVRIGKSLFAELQTWMDTQEKKSNLLPADEIKLDDELKEQLKALGYIN